MNSNDSNHYNSIAMQRNNNNNSPRSPYPKVIDKKEEQAHDFKPPRIIDPSKSPPKIRRTLSLPNHQLSSPKKQVLQRANSDISPIKNKENNKMIHNEFNKENKDNNKIENKNEFEFAVPSKHITLSNKKKYRKVNNTSNNFTNNNNNNNKHNRMNQMNQNQTNNYNKTVNNENVNHNAGINRQNNTKNMNVWSGNNQRNNQRNMQWNKNRNNYQNSNNYNRNNSNYGHNRNNVDNQRNKSWNNSNNNCNNGFNHQNKNSMTKMNVDKPNMTNMNNVNHFNRNYNNNNTYNKPFNANNNNNNRNKINYQQKFNTNYNNNFNNNNNNNKYKKDSFNNNTNNNNYKHSNINKKVSFNDNTNQNNTLNMNSNNQSKKVSFSKHSNINNHHNRNQQSNISNTNYKNINNNFNNNKNNSLNRNANNQRKKFPFPKNNNNNNPSQQNNVPNTNHKNIYNNGNNNKNNSLNMNTNNQRKNVPFPKNNNNRNPQNNVSNSNHKNVNNNVNNNKNNAIPTNINTNDMKKLSYWGLPSILCAGYENEGIKSLYDWQVECMNNVSVLRGGNLVYSAPTGGGKTLVAELLMLRNILRTKRKAIFVLPFVSIVVEKVRYFTKIFKRAKIKVKGFYSNKGGAGGLGRNCDIAICTIEKANSVVNRLITDNKLMSTIGIVVLDEMHMIGDGHRGYILEILLTKIRYVQEKIGDQYRKSIEKQVNIMQHNDGEMLSQQGDGNQIHGFPSMNPEHDDASNRIQVVGLSATLPNLDIICNWLSATKYITTYRPIPLKEYIKLDNQILDKHGDMVRKIGMRGGVKRQEDQDQISVLCAEVVQKKLSCIVFCHSKKQCQILATKLSKLLPRMVVLLKADKEKKQKQRSMILFKLKKCSFGADTVLSQTISSGVAYHHAGLTIEERSIVEDAFTKGIINVITATSTLAAGVNLPARRVIFRNMKMGWNNIDIANYQQMSGRAGRAGKDTAGESILCIKKKEKKAAIDLMNSPLPPLKSCLSLDMVGLTRILNEAIASKIVKTVKDIERFIKCTLLKAQTQDYDAVHQAAHQAIKFLAHNNFIQWHKSIKEWIPTKLGLATFASSMDPEHAITLYRDLCMANNKVIIADDLHILYQITPLPCYVNPPWQSLIEVYERMNETRREIIRLLGLDIAFFNTLCHSGKPSITKVKERVRQYNDKSIEMNNNENKNEKKVIKPKRDSNGLTFDHKVVIAQRLWAALIICDIVKEIPSMQIAHKFDVDHGFVQSLQASVSTFAGMVNIFCEKLNWWELRILVCEYQERVKFGFMSKHEEKKLKPFFKLGHNIMTKTIARVLYENEISTIELLSNQNAEEIQNMLSESTPFQLKQHSNYRRNGIDPRLGMKLVYVAKQFMKHKNEMLQQRLQKRDNAMTQMSGFKNANGGGDVTPSGTQYNMNHGYKVNIPKNKSKESLSDKLFHNSLHTQKPYTQLSIKEIPSNLLNTHNDELLKNKKFTPKKRSFCDITPSQIFTPKPSISLNDSNNASKSNSNSPLIQNDNHNQKQDINTNCNENNELQHPLPVIYEQNKNKNKMEVDNEEAHDPEEKQHCIEDRHITPYPRNSNNTSMSQTMMNKHITTPLNAKQRCQSVPVINSKEVIDPVVMKEVFADFFSPSSHGNLSGLQKLNQTITPITTKQLLFESISKTPNDNNQLLPQEPALKKRKLNCSHPQVTSQVYQQVNTNPNHPNQTSKKCQYLPRINNLVPDLNDSDDDVLITNQQITQLSQQLKANANVDTPDPEQEILVNETQYPSITPLPNPKNRPKPKPEFCSILFPETPATPFGDCMSFEKNVAKLITAQATMCDLYIPGIIEINEENEDDVFIQRTQSYKKQKQHGPLANRLQTQLTNKKKSDKQEMSDDDGDGDGDAKMKDNQQNLSNSEVRRRIRKEGGFGKVYLEKKSMNKPLNVSELNIHDEELERELWNKCIPPCIKQIDCGVDGKIPFVPLVINVFVNEETYNDFINKWGKQRAFSWSLWGKYDQLPVMDSKLESAFAPSCRGKIGQLTRSHIGGFAISWSCKRSYIIEINHILRKVADFVCKPMIWSDIVGIFENPRTIKISYNCKMQIQILKRIGINIKGKIWDPRIGHWLIEPDEVSTRSNDMYYIFRCWCPNVLEAQGKLLNANIEIHDQLVTIPPGKKALSTVSRDHGLHTWKIWLCMHFMISTLYRRKLLRSFLLIETKLITVLVEMEYHGIGFDNKLAKRYEIELDCKIDYLCSMAHTLVGQTFNLASPKECSHILYNVLKLKPPQKAVQLAKKKQRENKNKNKKNNKPMQLSTKGEVLQQMIDLHPLPGIIMEYRTLSKFLQTYVEPLPRMTAKDKYFCIQRIHSSVLQTSTATGRLAMTWPNLQSINKSIKFEPVHRYSVWEETKYRSDLSDFLTRLNVNENTKDLQVIVANCIDPNDIANAIIAKNDKQMMNTHIYGTLLSAHSDRTIKDPFPGGNNLMEYWKEKGFQFKDDNVIQVVVRVSPFNSYNLKSKIKERENNNNNNNKLESSQSCLYTYPADKVWRIYAFEKIKKHEIEDKLISDPMLNTNERIYPFKSVNFCPRDAFIAPSGYVLLAADYSQIELRILAHFANDTDLISVIKNGLDVMKDVASSITGKGYDEVTDDERQKAKGVVYGMLYGQTYVSLAHELKISINDAMKFYKKFRDKYPKSAICLDNIVKECREKEYITTLLGRRRYLRHINEKTITSKRMQAERQAVNSVCQGSAADLVKLAMIRINNCLEMLEDDYHGNGKKTNINKKQIEWTRFQRPKYYAKLVLQIHDELLFEIREDIVEYIAQIVKLTMENCMDLRVPLHVKMKVGKSWGTMKKYDVKK